MNSIVFCFLIAAVVAVSAQIPAGEYYGFQENTVGLDDWRFFFSDSGSIAWSGPPFDDFTEGSYKIDTSRTPFSWIDIVVADASPDGLLYEGIYTFTDGALLRILFAEADSRFRPVDFTHRAGDLGFDLIYINRTCAY